MVGAAMAQICTQGTRHATHQGVEVAMALKDRHFQWVGLGVWLAGMLLTGLSAWDGVMAVWNPSTWHSEVPSGALRWMALACHGTLMVLLGIYRSWNTQGRPGPGWWVLGGTLVASVLVHAVAPLTVGWNWLPAVVGSVRVASVGGALLAVLYVAVLMAEAAPDAGDRSLTHTPVPAP